MAYRLFQLLTGAATSEASTPISRTIFLGGLKECVQRKSPRFKTFLSLLHLEPEGTNESVSPQKQELLELTYKPRPLKDYDHQIKTLSQFDWSFNPKIPKEEIMAFVNTPWMEEASNLVLIGDTGLGKSHLAKALLYEAVLKGYSTLFTTAFDLISKIKKSINPVSLVDYYGRIQVLCLDELGYTYHQKEDTDLLFQILSKRSEVKPTLVTTNLTPKEWGTIFSGPAASAILDRLSYHGKFMTLEGNSYRLKQRKK